MDVVVIVVPILAGIVAILGGLIAAVRWLMGRSEDSSADPIVSESNVTTEGDVNAPVTTGGATGASEHGPGIGVARDVTIIQGGLDVSDKERLNRIEGILEEIARGTAAPGTPQPDTAELAAQATGAIEEQLEEALELFHAGQYREAIEGVLTAYDRALPPLAKAQLNLVSGNAFHALGEFDSATVHYRETLRAAPNPSWKAAAITGLGLVHAFLDELPEAEERFNEARGIQERIGDRAGLATTFGNLGIVYAKRGARDDAEEYFRKALVIEEEIGNRVGQASELGNLGVMYARRGDLDHAEEYHRKALGIDEEIGYRLGQAQDLGNLGLVYARRGDLEEAEERYSSALEIAEEIGARPLVSQIHDLLEHLKALEDLKAVDD